MLRASGPARVINVSSDAHRGGAINFADPQLAHDYSGWRAYSQSKLANILFPRELARRLEGMGVTANALHPGFVASNFASNTGGLIGVVFGIAKRIVAISPEAGAETSVYLATSPEVAGVSGQYFDKCRVVEPSRAAQDAAAAEPLWQISEELVAANAPALR
jgi:NAD(P)-dependent dehydrogenase (short-subunit alcohol dehydrogenase family)